MPKHPDSFPDVDLSGTGIELPEGSEPEFIAGGFNSSAWIVGTQVLKITSQAKIKSNATKLLDAMEREHETLEPFIGAHMTETNYSLAEDMNGEGFRVLAVQPLIEGVSLADFFDRPDANVEPFIEFLERSREAYTQTGLMPDISCIEKLFWPLKDSNTLILEDRDDHPMLVDTTSGKTQRSGALGPLWNHLIFRRAGQAINHLSWRLYDMKVANSPNPVQAEEF